MAHTCPDCGMICYCGGDIDDCCFDDSEEAMACTCCFGKDEMDDDYYDEAERKEMQEDAKSVKGDTNGKRT